MTPGRRALESLLGEAIGPVDRADLFLVRLPFVAPFAISTAVWTTKDALLLRLEAGGLTAWGECVADPDPFYASETTVTARHVLKDFLVPLLEPGLALGELDRRMRRVRGHEMAKATLENALLDLIAKRRRVPLHALLGAPRKKVMSGISIGLQDSPAALVAAVEAAVGKKYHRVKMKIRKGQDVEYVRAVRERFPGLPLMADANGDYRLDDAEHLARLDAFDLMMIEQPLSYDDVYFHSILQKSLRTPICLDESIHGLDDAAAAIALGGCRILNLKQGRVGGLMESMRILGHAAEKGIPVWSGGMDETGIGRAVNIHLQALDGFTLPGDTSETSRYFHEDLVEPPVVLDAEGFIEIPRGDGIGVAVVPERLERRKLSEERLF
ncbi:MAG TPA: o-succinylbenzoate synthase [Thermoanaerobaculia bacterium]|nr:o-succinylbenzoate synthase [Thermoanaerobaculia bacterium]HQR67519.1 o-succinylbenzoate synthase [Thermoanaerobaculia bacterium]